MGRIIETLCENEIDKSGISEIKRIGKKTENSRRPLIVKTKDQSTKRKILLNANKLQGCGDDELKTIRMSHDLTQQEREHSKNLYEEAKRRENEDASGGFKYKVRGPPWDMKIVRIKISH